MKDHQCFSSPNNILSTPTAYKPVFDLLLLCVYPAQYVLYYLLRGRVDAFLGPIRPRKDPFIPSSVLF